MRIVEFICDRDLVNECDVVICKPIFTSHLPTYEPNYEALIENFDLKFQSQVEIFFRKMSFLNFWQFLPFEFIQHAIILFYITCQTAKYPMPIGIDALFHALFRPQLSTLLQKGRMTVSGVYLNRIEKKTN